MPHFLVTLTAYWVVEAENERMAEEDPVVGDLTFADSVDVGVELLDEGGPPALKPPDHPFQIDDDGMCSICGLEAVLHDSIKLDLESHAKVKDGG